ncbi:hypothetical protein ACB098_06G129200 [Castanea mollissima]|uniref:WRKY domain-containing protein n=1 Tax=Castanea mollissima TaxID=60419 RepID=A0A8J4VQR0_9ROSI|nr:hypothetical protein CMV_006937 [Castanea mollissima]
MEETNPISIIRQGCKLAREFEAKLPNLTDQHNMLLTSCDEIIKVFDTAKERLCTTQFQDPLSHTPMNMLIRQAQESQQTQIEAAADLQGWLRSSYTQAMDIFQLQLQADQSRNPFGTQKLGSDVHVAAGRDHAEASARSRSIGGGEFPVPPIDVSDSGTGNSSSQRQRRRRDDGERRTLTVPVPRIGNTEIPPEDGFTWRKYGQKEILGSKHPRGYFRCTHQKLYQCPAKKLVQRLDDDPYMFEVTYRGSHTCHMSSTAPSIPPPPDQISHDIAQFIASQPLPSSTVPLGSWLSMDSLGGGSGMAIGGGGSGSGSGAGPSTARSGKEVEFPVADMADVMFNSGSSSSNSMDFLFQAPEDVKWKPGDKQG